MDEICTMCTDCYIRTHMCKHVHITSSCHLAQVTVCRVTLSSCIACTIPQGSLEIRFKSLKGIHVCLLFWMHSRLVTLLPWLYAMLQAMDFIYRPCVSSEGHARPPQHFKLRVQGTWLGELCCGCIVYVHCNCVLSSVV